MVKAVRGGSRRVDELFRRNSRLPKNSRKGADLNVLMGWNNAAHRIATHDDVTAALANDAKAKPLKPAHDLGTRNARQLRHGCLPPRT
jgi:hypothetical protein